MKRISLIIFLLLSVGIPAGLAQSLPDLTQQYTSDDGSLVIQYPSGWAVEEGETISLATSPATLKAALAGTSPTGEEIVFTFLTPAAMAEIGITAATPDEAINALMDATGLSGVSEPYVQTDLPAATAFVSADDLAFGQLIAVQFGTGIVMAAIEFADDPQNHTAIVAHIIGGLTYEGQATGKSSVAAESKKDGLRQWASFATASSQYGENGWSAMQATGEPDTADCGDYTSAWASATSTGSDILALEFDQAVIPTQVNIYQTYNPGSITRVELTNTDTGEIISMPDSADPPGNTPCPGAFTLDISGVDTLVNGVIIYFDQSIGGSWNEIDAVELVSGSTEVAEAPAATAGDIQQWANFATGSSQYGEDGWSFMQATGEPDTDGCGDSLQAWASSSSSTSEILALEFEQAVIPTQVNIHQTYNPGSITRIELTNTDTGEVIPVPDSADPPGNTPCPGVFSVDITGVDTLVNGVIIYFDQSIGGSWNEIDAVELVGRGESTAADDDAVSETEAESSDGDTLNFVTADFQGQFTLEYPESWAIDFGGAPPAIASTEDMLYMSPADDPGTEVSIQIVLPDMLAQMGVGDDASAMEAAEALAAQFASTAPIEDYAALNNPAAYSQLNGNAPQGSHLITVETADGVYAFAIRTHEFDSFAPVIHQIINSLSG